MTSGVEFTLGNFGGCGHVSHAFLSCPYLRDEERGIRHETDTLNLFFFLGYLWVYFIYKFIKK